MLRKIVYCILFLIILIIFKSWFLGELISSGDFNFRHTSQLLERSLQLYAWEAQEQNSLGGATAPLLWIYFMTNIPIVFLVKIFGPYWTIIQKVTYLYPFLIIGIFSSYSLSRYILKQTNLQSLSILLYLCNTYILMMIGGGQILISLAYAIFPWIFLQFIKCIHPNKDISVNLKTSIITGLIFSIQAIFDIRIAYIALIAVGIFFLTKIEYNISKQNILYTLNILFFTFAIPLSITLLLHAFWILPTLFNRINPITDLGSAYSSIEAVKFFSFAKLENTISLLHPNWPENIFGKVYFMKSEFLLLPILAYVSLFFVSSESKKQQAENKNLAISSKIQDPRSKIQDPRIKNYVIYFALLGLLGAFLAKGANDPFGGVYIWLFEHFPGFVMFRDSTKWYTLVALSYSILIPYSISKIYNWLKSQSKFQISNFKFQINTKNPIFNLQNLFIFLVLSFMLFLIRPALLGQLGGTFKSTNLPGEYLRLENHISKDRKFYRTLWLPQVQRFAFFSNNHPAVSANNLFEVNSPKENINFLKKETTQEMLQNLSIKYLIIPYDSQGELFLADRKYDHKVYLQTLKDVDSISYLRKIEGFGRIGVYEIQNFKDHFWSPNSNLEIKYKYINPTKYQLELTGAKKGNRLIFSESYDKEWIIRNSNFEIQSSKFQDKFNSFILPENGDYDLEVYYRPQKFVEIGSIISLISLGTILIILTGLIINQRKMKNV